MARRKQGSDIKALIDGIGAIFALIGLIFSFFQYLYEKIAHKKAVFSVERAPQEPLRRADIPDRSTERIIPGSAKRLNAKYEIKKFLDSDKKEKLIIFDLETNGLDPSYSVLSCSAIKYEIDPLTYEMNELDCFDRYYYPVEQYSPGAIAVNGLTEEVITRHRGDCCDYPRHFAGDEDFKKFCRGINLVVAHNVSFDTRFAPHLKRKKKFCTMMINTDIVAVRFLEWKGEWKWPTLSETADFYGVSYQGDGLHRSINDTRITEGIFRKMLEAVKAE